MTETEKAYLAGFVDGEGTITLAGLKTKTHVFPCYVPRVNVANNNKKILQTFQKAFGGYVYERKRLCSENCKRSFYFTVSNKRAKKLIEKLLPYLRQKKQVATLVLNYPRRGGRSLGYKRGTKPDLAGYKKQLAIVKKVRKLNQRGVTP